jgi:hypothetical protein
VIDLKMSALVMPAGTMCLLRTINFSDPEDKARHEKMVALVTKILQSISDLIEKKSSGFFEEVAGRQTGA